MPMNTHYSGRLANAIERTMKKAEGREGKFYEIFNKYDFYDVNDENNGLTKEQREQVPVENQTRYTQFANAIADMFRFALADGEYGILTKDLQNIVDKLDTRSSANNAQLNAIGSGLAGTAGTPLAPLAAIDASRRIMDAQTTMTMGSNPYNADMIPPIAIGLDGLPVSIANVFKPGFFQPNWDFLFTQEPVKSNKFYDAGDGKMRIGANILLDQGGDRRDLFLKNIFAVNTTDKNLTPIGDVKGGLTAEQYDVVREAAVLSPSTVLNEDTGDAKYRDFRLNDSQVQASFFKYVQMRLWGAINNRRNWAHSHWGPLTHNSCPEYVKTAVCSFLWTNGLAIEQNKSDEAAFISYCLTMGVYYLTGYQYKVAMSPISGFDRIISASGANVSVEEAITDTDYAFDEVNGSNIIAFNGVPKDQDIANRYFTWIADILIRLTASTNGEDTDILIRKRRVAEANLIYRGLGHPSVEYGASLSKLDYFHTEGGLKERNFDKLMALTILRYPNEGAAGGSGTNSSLIEPEADAVKINYDSSAQSDIVTDLTLNVIRRICVDAGVREITITSTYRPPEVQARVMFNNLQNNNRVNYAAPGRAVVKVYDDKKAAYGIPYGSPVSDANQIADIKQSMLAAIENAPPQNISKHSAQPSVVQAIDISPTRMKPISRKASFRSICMQYNKQGVLKAFLGPKPDGPGSDPAFHIEVWQDDRKPDGFSSDPAINNKMPEEQFSIGNPNFAKASAWIIPIAKDHVDKANADSGSEDQA